MGAVADDGPRGEGREYGERVVDQFMPDAALCVPIFFVSHSQVRCMKLVQHPNVVRLYEVIDTQTKLYLILELGDGGDLYDYIMRHDSGLSEEVTSDRDNAVAIHRENCGFLRDESDRTARDNSPRKSFSRFSLEFLSARWCLPINAGVPFVMSTLKRFWDNRSARRCFVPNVDYCGAAARGTGSTVYYFSD